MTSSLAVKISTVRRHLGVTATLLTVAELAALQARLKQGGITPGDVVVSTDLQYMQMRDDSSSSSSATFLRLDTHEIQTFNFNCPGYSDHTVLKLGTDLGTGKQIV